MPTTISTTTVATALVSNQSPHIYMMSNGDTAAIYFSGSNWAYRVKSGGSWGSATNLAGSIPTTGADLGGASCRNGDTIYFGAGSNTTAFIVAKMVFNTGTHVFTLTYSASTGDSAPVFSLYYDSTNSLVHALVRLSDVNAYLYGFAAGNLANSIAGTSVTGAPADSAGAQKFYGYCLVGDGTSAFFVVMNNTPSGTAVLVTRISSGATSYTQTAETSVTALAAANKGITATYDGTNIIFVANQNNAALRTMSRTAINTYTAWSSIDASAVANPPALTRLTSDLLATYQRTSGQANGEIYTVARTSGSWGAAALLAGGATSGWSYPTAAPNDLNDTAGTSRMGYLTGTANPWTFTEDVVAAAAAQDTPELYGRPAGLHGKVQLHQLLAQ